MPAAREKKAFVVSHTHWDREWYLTFHRFRARLVDVVDEVLRRLEEGGAFRHFLMDGQAAVLLDYLEVRPGERERIARLVAAGALSIGPWFVLPDEFLISSEAHVRNLLAGHRVCRELGGAQKVGYMPDSFGHIAQMPQILRRGGIDSFVYTRGNGDEIDDLGLEYRWRAPDGSEVLAVNQWRGYCNAGALGYEEMWHAHTRREVDVGRAVGQVERLLGEMEERANGSVLLVMNGCDHLPAQPKLGGILDALADAVPGVGFVHGSLADYLAAFRVGAGDLPAFEGELLGGRHHLVLSGVWSARMPLKQANDRAQEALAAVAEPIAAYGRFVLGRDWPAGLLDRAWRLLLLNHPHDSICGCSTDEVHREMMPRFAGATETAESVVGRVLDAICPMFGRRPEDDRETVVAVMNPLPERRTEVVERVVVLTPGDPDLSDLCLIDEAGRAVPFEVVSERCVRRLWGVDHRALPTCERQLEALRRALLEPAGRAEGDRFVHLRFLARDLPPIGHASVRLVPRRGDAAAPAAAVRVQGDALENGLVRVRLRPDGVFDLTDLRTGRAFPGLNLLEDAGDAGDEYDFSEAPEGGTVTAEGAAGEVRAAAAGSLAASLEATFALALPARLADDRRRRNGETVACPVTVRVRLATGSPLVAVTTTFGNRAADHRLRAAFPTAIRTSEVLSDGHFLVNRRPLRRPTGEDWVQPAPPTWPQQELSLVEDGDGGLAVLNRGLPEIEATADPDGAARLHLTLLRCVGWLSRDDFASRKRRNAGPTLPTPEAQCPGEHRFEYAVLPFAGGWLEADVKGASARWRRPPLTRQGVADGLVPGGPGLLEKETSRTAITAVKRAEERETLVVRLVNLAGEPSEETLRAGRPVRAAWRTDLLEAREEALEVASEREVRVALGPHEIATVELELT